MTKFNILIDKISKDELESFWKLHTHKEICEHFSINEDQLLKLLKYYGLKKTANDKSIVIKAGMSGYAEKLDKQMEMRKADLYNYYIVENHSVADTAMHLGLSKAGVKALLTRYGIIKQAHKATEPFDSVLSRVSKEMLLKDQWKTKKELQEQYNIGERTLMKLFKHYSIEKRRAACIQYDIKHADEYAVFTIGTRDDMIRFLRSFNEPKSREELAAYFNVSFSTITQQLQKNDLSDYVKNFDNLGTSGLEDTIINYIGNEYKVIRNTRNVLPSKKEIDIYLPDLKLGFEINGTYWHSTLNGKDKKYHFNKSQEAESIGVHLIHIYEYELLDNPEKVYQVIDSALGRTERIFARNCDIHIIDNTLAKPFETKYHIQGYRPAKITYGLFYKDELLELMSFSKNNKGTAGDWEIIRGCTKAGITVVGGTSKLFKHFISDNSPKSIFTYCDYNKFTGRSYEAIGMSFIGFTVPDFKWVMPNRTVVNRNPSKNKELKELAIGKIYGTGSKKYIWTQDK